MKRWIKRTLIALVGASALFGGLAAWAHHRHHGWHAMSEQDAAAMKARVVERVSKKLELDEAQKAKLSVLADRMREQRQALMGSTPDPRAELQSLLVGPTFDRAKAGALVESKLGAVQAKSPALIAALADFYDSLKPAQQQQVRDFMARGRGHLGERS